jgi:RNA polymerase sigma-70 factor (ECF subfamily)
MGKLLHLPTNEKKLVKQCCRGKSSAQQELYQRFGGQMLSVCRRYTKSVEDAEEVLSNGFIKVFSKIDQYKGEGALGGWIRTIMVREALNFIRYQKNIFIEVENEDYQAEFGHQEELEALEAQHLLLLIDELPTGYKTVFNLYAIEGYNHREIGALLGVSENTSKSQLSKARKQLQQRLAKQNILYKQN